MSNFPNATATATINPSTPLLAVYWLLVILPLGWGVYQTVQKSIPLFHVTASGTAVATPPTATPPPP